MKYPEYDISRVEEDIRSYWEKIQLHKQLHKIAYDESKEPFYFLDGPPYTSGQVHIGTAWNKTMKDFVVRLRRMQGKAVWDRAGYDMHGLPNENATMKELDMKTNEDIFEYGVAEFIQACKKRGVNNLKKMNKDFARIGVSLDFENAYQTISDEWIQAVWHLIHTAYEGGRLYEGKRPMAWDPIHESALAKHELEYKSVEDTSIYVKFKRLDADEYFIIWTTTPWTIPFNLMIMMNPELTYAKVRVQNETWIIAEDLVDEVLEAAKEEGEIIETVLGEEFIGSEYEHFFSKELDYASIKQKHPNTHTIVGSTEYVTTEAGTGLVHAAPGCGPEDYEVGIEYDVPAWNLLDSKGVYSQGCGVFSGVRAREEDEVFVEEIIKCDALVASKSYVHEYPHAERSKAAVVYKATDQWFFKVDDLKEDMIAANNQVNWNPKAGYNAFNSWLENLRDNSITKQRFFGTPIPLWKSEDGDVIVVKSKQELKELSGQEITDLHKPYIDDVTITKNNKTYKRIPDVVDVWVDAGVAHLACLGYPQTTEHYDRFWPADFIIEGNDQIRGWFNLLMVTSMLSTQKAPFKNVYMHGMIQDSKGRKMSKSVGNYITPDEVIDAYGADASRLYFLSNTRAGNDFSYNDEDVEQKQRELHIYWNIHKYLLDLINTTQEVDLSKSELTIEDKYIRSHAQHTLKHAQQALDEYQLEKVVGLSEELLKDISREYIQYVRSRQDQDVVRAVLSEVYLIGIQLLAAVSPFITEAIWQNLKEPLGLDEQSIHQSQLPSVQEELIDTELQEEIQTTQRVISAILAARDRAQIGVRWPLAVAKIQGVNNLSQQAKELITEHTNVNEIQLHDELELTISIQPDYRRLGKSFGKDTGAIAEDINKNAKEYAKTFSKEQELTVLGHTITREHLEVSTHAPTGYSLGEDLHIHALLLTKQTPELIEEGYRRELIRRVQQARKEADLDKTDTITLTLSKELLALTKEHHEQLMQGVGASKIEYGDPSSKVHLVDDTVKDKRFYFGFFANT